MNRVFGTIEIVDYTGHYIQLCHSASDIDKYAESIIGVLGNGWAIYHINYGYVKIGPKNPQTDDVMKVLGIPAPANPTMSDAWLTTVEIETEYGLPTGSVRRDIHRGKFNDDELKKVGRDWTIRMDAADRLYDKR